MKLIRISYFFGLLSLILFLFSCKKEIEAPTQAEKNQQELQRVIGQNNIRRIYAFEYPGGGWSSLSASAGQTWTFSNGFISIGGDIRSRNLSYLYTYNIANVTLDNGTTSSALLLYFK